MKSENEDADLAEVITNLKMEETVYRASLASGSRIMQQSLVDFMR
jgi:flagellar hook-associated protein 3 FlgL